jgi:hypothetical protein
MSMRFSALVLVGLGGWFGLCRVLVYRKFFLMVSRLSFSMLVGLGFIMSPLVAVLMAVSSVLVGIGSMLMCRFLVAIIGRAACC